MTNTLTIVYSIFIIVFIKIMQKKVFRKGRCDMVPVIDNIETGNNIRRIMQNQGLTVKRCEKSILGSDVCRAYTDG